MSRHDIAAQQLDASCVRLGWRDPSGKRIKVGQYVRQRSVRQLNGVGAAGIAAAPFGHSRRADQPHVNRFRKPGETAAARQCCLHISLGTRTGRRTTKRYEQ
jgi:hypothetical protein